MVHSIDLPCYANKKSRKTTFEMLISKILVCLDLILEISNEHVFIQMKIDESFVWNFSNEN